MNRAQRRQAARAAGQRGTKAKRTRTTAAPRVDDTATRQRARAFGLLVPLSPAEIDQAMRDREAAIRGES